MWVIITHTYSTLGNHILTPSTQTWGTIQSQMQAEMFTAEIRSLLFTLACCYTWASLCFNVDSTLMHSSCHAPPVRLRKLNAPLAIVYKSQLHWAWIPTVSYAHHNCIFQTDNWKHNASYIISDLQWAVRSMDIAWLQLIWGSLMFAQKEQMDVKIAGAYCNCMSGQ